jgi:CO/xanthine dehydrogenase FAD-binding subunit
MDLNTIQSVLAPARREDFAPWTEGDAWLAGGTWLFSEPQTQLTRLVDLLALGWAPLEGGPDGLSVSATCTIAELDALEPRPDWIAAPLVGQCCRALLGSFKIWNRATVGGNLCMALPAGPMTSLMTALEAVCVIWTRDGGERRLPVSDFVTGPQQTALEPGELLRSVEVAASALKARTAFRQISLSPLGRSGALLIGSLDPATGAFALTVTASVRRPVRLEFPVLPDARDLRDRIQAEINDALYYDDVHGAPDWRRQVTFLLAEEIRAELGEGGRP